MLEWFSSESKCYVNGLQHAYRQALRSDNDLQIVLLGAGHSESEHVAVICQFERKYNELIVEPRPYLAPASKRFAEYAAFVEQLGVGLEDYSRDALFENKAMLLQLDRLNMQLRFCTDLQRTLFIANMVLDALLSACLIPAASIFRPGKHDTDLHFDYTCELSRHWVQGLPLDLCEELVKELRLGCNDANGLQHSILLCSVDIEEYVAMTTAQRVAELSLCNFTLMFRNKVKNDSLVKAVVESPNLSLWMLSCSSADEQYWLNTCENAARNVMIALRMPTIAHCIAFTRDIIGHLRDTRLSRLPTAKPWTKSLLGKCYKMESIYQYCCFVLDSAEEQLNGLCRRAEAALAMPVGSALMLELQTLLCDWNKTTQFLSSVYYPEEPVVLSRKLFSDRWQLSAKVWALPCIVGSFLPGQPHVLSRNEGTPGEYDRSGSRFLWRDAVSEAMHPEFKDIDKTLRGKSLEEAGPLLNQLWNLAFNYGGLFFASKEHIFSVEVGHLNGLFAVNVQNKRHFLICDPEICRFKLVNMVEMLHAITSPLVSFNLFDT